MKLNIINKNSKISYNSFKNKIIKIYYKNKKKNKIMMIIKMNN